MLHWKWKSKTFVGKSRCFLIALSPYSVVNLTPSGTWLSWERLEKAWGWRSPDLTLTAGSAQSLCIGGSSYSFWVSGFLPINWSSNINNSRIQEITKEEDFRKPWSALVCWLWKAVRRGVCASQGAPGSIRGLPSKSEVQGSGPGRSVFWSQRWEFSSVQWILSSRLLMKVSWCKALLSSNFMIFPLFSNSFSLPLPHS